MKWFTYKTKESDCFEFRIYAATRKNADRFLPRLVKDEKDWEYVKEE